MTKAEHIRFLDYCVNLLESSEHYGDQNTEWFEKAIEELRGEKQGEVYVYMGETTILGIYTSKEELAIAHMKHGGSWEKPAPTTMEEALVDLDGNYPCMEVVETNKLWMRDR